MNRDKLETLASFMPPVIMAALMAASGLLGSGAHDVYILLGLEALVLVLPFVIILLLTKLLREKPDMRLRGFFRKSIPFVFTVSLAAALMNFLVGAGIAELQGRAWQPDLSLEGYGGWQTALIFALSALIPAVAEELLFRSAVLGALEKRGSWVAIIFSAVSFALLHGNAENLVAPFMSGLVYGWLAVAIGSVWPAVIAHIVNNCLNLLMSLLYPGFLARGFWLYFLLICFALMCILVISATKSADRLIAIGKIRRFERKGAARTAVSLLLMPGIWVLAILYILRTV